MRSGLDFSRFGPDVLLEKIFLCNCCECWTVIFRQSGFSFFFLSQHVSLTYVPQVFGNVLLALILGLCFRKKT